MLGEGLFFYFIYYYGKYFLVLSRANNRHAIRTNNEELDVMRKKHVKTLDEQKEFLDKKYPKSGNYKFSFYMILNILIQTLIFLFLFYFFYSFLRHYNIEISFTTAIMTWLICPLIISWFLRKFKLQNDDLTEIMRLRK